MTTLKSAILLFCGIAVATPAIAQQERPSNEAPVQAGPEAADMTLGMALMWARLNSSGALPGGAGGINTLRDGTGVYRVFFARPIVPSDRAVIVSLSTVSSASIAKATWLSSADDNDVIIRAFNTAGAPTDGDPFLLVYCTR